MDSISTNRPNVDSLNPLSVGARLQEFVIERLIGIGGFGIVYQANDTLLHRTVAIKEYMPTSMASRSDGATVSLRSESYVQDFETGKASFINEARMLARFKHPALIEVFRFWEQNSTAYMATPFYEGQTLKQRLRSSPGVPEEETLKQILFPVLDALEHMHREQIYHRDISPDNIMILQDGRPILLDLGAARRLETENAQALTVLVKPGYAPIEQYAGDAAIQQGPWTDIYGWGATAYFALTGKPPPPSASRIMSDSIVKVASLKPNGYSEALLMAIDAALAVRPDDRPQSVAALKLLLSIDAAPETTSPRRKAVEKKSVPIEDTYPTVPMPQAASSATLERPNAPDVPTPIATKSTSELTFEGPPPAKSLKANKTNPRGMLLGGMVCAIGLFAAFLWFATPAANNPIAKAETSSSSSAKTESPKRTEPSASAPGQLEPPQAASMPATPPLEKRQSEVQSEFAIPSPASKPIAPTAIKKASIDPATSQQAASNQVASDQPANDKAVTEKAASDKAASDKSATDKPALARLSIKPWGEVYVNGEARGVSPPLKTISLVAGEYSFEIRNGDYPIHKVRIKLKSGEVYRINHAFVDPAQKQQDKK